MKENEEQFEPLVQKGLKIFQAVLENLPEGCKDQVIKILLHCLAEIDQPTIDLEINEFEERVKVYRKKLERKLPRQEKKYLNLLQKNPPNDKMIHTALQEYDKIENEILLCDESRIALLNKLLLTIEKFLQNIPENLRQTVDDLLFYEISIL